VTEISQIYPNLSNLSIIFKMIFVRFDFAELKVDFVELKVGYAAKGSAPNVALHKSLGTYHHTVEGKRKQVSV
jgi:hypothetical protein